MMELIFADGKYNPMYRQFRDRLKKQYISVLVPDKKYIAS